VAVQIGAALLTREFDMGAYRDQHGRWRYRKRIELLDGGYVRVKGSPALNTKAAAEEAERAHIQRTIRGSARAHQTEGGDDAQEILRGRVVAEVQGRRWEAGDEPADVAAREGGAHPVAPGAAPGAPAPRQVTNERVMELFGKLRLEGFTKQGRRPSSSTPVAARKRKQRALGRGIEEQEQRRQPKKRGLGEKSVRNIRATLRTALSYTSAGVTCR
jgi:hypothetical protein